MATSAPIVNGAGEPTVNGAVEPQGKPARARRGKPADRPAGKRSLNLSLPVDDYERLQVHAMKLRTTVSALVSRLAREHCREYHISRTGTRGEQTGP